jgi:hypothetical protein
MRIYVDESGDPGTKFRKGSTRHLCIGCVLLDDYVAAGRMVQRFRSRKNWPEDREIKWSRSDEQTRMEFLRCLDQEIFQTCSLVVDKQMRVDYDHIKKRAYEHALIRGLEHALDLAGGFVEHVIVDQRDEDKSSKREVARRVRQALNGGRTRVGEVSLRDSRHEDVLQIADMVVGESHFTSRTGDLRYRNIVRPLLTEYR